MHIGIISIGSRGDVQPYIALSLGLMKRGYKVTLAAPENFSDFVENFGVSFHPLPNNTERVINSPEGERLLKKGSTISLLKFFKKEGDKTRQQVRSSLLEGCLEVDFIITSYISTNTISVIAEKLKKKWAIVNLNPPLLPTNEAPAFGFDFMDFPFYNRLTYSFIHYLEWNINKKDIREFRKSLGLPFLGTTIPKPM